LEQQVGARGVHRICCFFTNRLLAHLVVFNAQRIGQLIRDFQRPMDLPVPQVPFQAFEFFLEVGTQLWRVIRAAPLAKRFIPVIHMADGLDPDGPGLAGTGR
jgi:hypothetical protein